jgi:UDP-N-acetylmuramoyl-tripeptide--D-alanyl-D-alanine ligase
MKKILEIILNILARLYLRKYKPMIIGVTGNVGKTSTKETIAQVARFTAKIRLNAGNLNNELGLPLTILGDYSDEYYSDGASLSFWTKVLVNGFWGLFRKINYPEILVLEYGADRPGDIKKLVRRFRPHIAVITAVGEIPVHGEYFRNKEHLADEKSELIKYLKADDFAVLNYDDSSVRNMQVKTKAKIMTYGFSDESSFKVFSYDVRYNQFDKPVGINFKIGKGVSFTPMKIDGSLGKSIALSVGAATAVGEILGVNMVKIGEIMENFKGQPGRLKILKGIKDSVIIDDSYNSSPAAVLMALDTLKSIRSGRKIVALGDMLELGEKTIEAHEQIGKIVGESADILICVGARSKFIAEAASNKMPKDKIYIFENSNEAKTKAQELLEAGDVVLVKGSQGMRMEKITEEIMAEPEKKSELLVRQSKKWLNKS